MLLSLVVLFKDLYFKTTKTTNNSNNSHYTKRFICMTLFSHLLLLWHFSFRPFIRPHFDNLSRRFSFSCCNWCCCCCNGFLFFPEHLLITFFNITIHSHGVKKYRQKIYTIKGCANTHIFCLLKTPAI